ASTEHFDVELGPIFANFVLADEINRAPAKVQSALLEVMAEGHVTIGGRTFPAPQPFLVLATQNPIESEGVYPLPEAQQDRFLMKLLISYPSYGEELEIVRRMSGGMAEVRPMLTPDDLVRLQAAAGRVYVDPAVADYAVRVVVATRTPAAVGVDGVAPYLAVGASPRASLGLVVAARALALLRGRAFAVPGDIATLAPELLRHRLVLSYEALADGMEPDDLIERVLAQVPAVATPTAREAARRGR
ncbi:MAG: AAA family ATPase, partial [Acidimicrobiia bacterium]